MDIDKLIGSYVALRDKKDEIAQRHKDELAPYNAAMDKIESAIHAAMQEQNVKSFKSAHGTAYTSELASAKVVDFEAALQYIQQHERWDMLERRVNKTVVQEIGDVPGVELTRSIKVNIRRK